MTVKQAPTLEQVARGIVDRETARFAYSGNVDLKTTTSHPCFSGCMDLLSTAKINVGFNPGFESHAQDLEAVVNNGDTPFSAAFTAVMRHELNHKGGGPFLGCPRDIVSHQDLILEPVAGTLKRLGFPNVPTGGGKTLYAYFANLVEDVLDNIEIGVMGKGDPIGLSLMYKDDALHIKNGTRFGGLFSAFVKLQHRFFGGQRSDRLLTQHYAEGDKADTAVDNFLHRTGLAKLTHEVGGPEQGGRKRKQRGKHEVLDRRRAVRYCLEKTHWPEIASVLTEEFAKLLDKDALSDPARAEVYIEETFVPIDGDHGDIFGEEMDDPNTQIAVVMRRYKDGKPQGTASDDDAPDVFEPPAFMDDFQALDVLYKGLARGIDIKTKVSTRTEAMPVMRYGHRSFDPRRDRLSRARVRMGRNGKPELTSRRYQVLHPIPYTESSPGLPNLRVVIMDTSGSMKGPIDENDESPGKIMNPWADEGRQWDNKSRYHHILLAWYGFQELLHRQGTLRHTSMKLVNYSSATQTARNLADSRRLALQPQFGGTKLNMAQLDNLFGRNELVLSLSDGDMANWNGWYTEPETDDDGNMIREGVLIKDEYIRRAKENEFIHFQVGAPTIMSRDLEAAGLKVHYDDGSNLGKLVIDITQPYITRSNGGKK